VRSRLAVGLASWVFGYIGFGYVPAERAVLELLGLDRPLVRTQAFDAADGLLVDSSVVMDGQLLPSPAGGLSGDLMVRASSRRGAGFRDATDDVKRRRARAGSEISIDADRSRTSPLRARRRAARDPEVDAKLIHWRVACSCAC